MANDEHVALLKQGVEVWNKWRREAPRVADLSKADLSRVDLSRADLNGADLNEVNLLEPSTAWQKFFCGWNYGRTGYEKC